MKTATPTPRSDTEALVVEHDPGTREQLVKALRQSGFGVQACDTLAEGRQQFSRQSVVVTHANGDTAELQGFVNFVRKTAGPEQPFILAVGEADSPSGLAQDSLGIDAFFPVPLAQARLARELQSVAESLGQPPTAQESAPAAPPNAAAPIAAAPFTSVLLEHLPQALALFDTNMRYLAANRRFTSAFGLSDSEMLGHSHYDLFPDLHAHWRDLFDQALQGESGRIEEDFFQRADGTSDWVRWDVRPWHHPDQTIGGVILSQEIITRQKREERRRVFDRNLACSLFESQSLPILLVGLDGRILRSSPAARSTLGLQPTADGRMPFWEVYPDRETEEIEKERFAALATPPADGTLGGYAPADILIPGTPVHRLHWSASPHRNTAGLTQAILLTGCLIPVAQRIPCPPPVPAPESPAHPSQLAASLATHAPFGLALLDRDGLVLATNEAVSALLGRELAPATAFEPWLADGAPEDVLRDPVVREWRDNVWRRQLPRTFSLINNEGLLKEIELRPRLLPNGHLLLILGDVTENRRAEDALRTSEAKYRGLFREFPTAIALADRSGSLVEGNPALEKLSGYSRIDFRRLRLNDLLDLPPGNPPAKSAFLLTRGGEKLPVTVSHGPIRNQAGETVLQAFFFLPRPQETETSQPSDAPKPPAGTAGTTPEAAHWRHLAFTSLSTAALVTDLRGRVRAANPAAARFFQTAEPGTLEDVALYRLFRPADPAGFSREVSDALTASQRWHAETTCYNPEGAPAGRCRAEITPAPNGSHPGLLCVIQPIFSPVSAA